MKYNNIIARIAIFLFMQMTGAQNDLFIKNAIECLIDGIPLISTSQVGTRCSIP